MEQPINSKLVVVGRTKTTVRHHFVPSRMVIIKKIIINYWQWCGEKWKFCATGGNAKLSSGTAAVPKSLAVPPKLNLESPHEPVIPLLGIN